MNGERLLAYYELIADATDSVARLRRFVLDVAMRGKLAPQDPTDEPALDLLTRIQKEKQRLSELGMARPSQPLPSIGNDTEFDVPKSWTWTRLGAITSYLQRGKSPKYAAAGGSPVISQKCIQ